MLEDHKGQLMNGASGTAMPPPQQPPGEANLEPQEPTPEENEQHKQFMGAALQLIYNDKTAPKIKQMLQAEGDPREGLIAAATLTVQQVLQQAQKRGVEYTPDVKAFSAKEVFEELGEHSKRLGVKDYKEDKEAFEGAYLRFTAQMTDQLLRSGQVNREVEQQNLAKLQEMDGRGELEQFLRSLAERDRAGPKNGLNVAGKK